MGLGVQPIMAKLIVLVEVFDEVSDVEINNLDLELFYNNLKGKSYE